MLCVLEVNIIRGFLVVKILEMVNLVLFLS